ncbi:xanthine and CO dehydrogenases maturation factor, XdhC/CoxF family [Rhizobium leguminosarum bv. trifolii WSM597]|uniref:Xanthine and CO dehydrogenases maturation factor, XdhC/CoxF family n=1 Tax=Rhizobium leguminosarum bv. trifolii WSM597 TaxID=754764 RepID=J0HD51_RHILT|nr:XdhC family protein [Rhizobium leguminosarum]EJB02354.1 xanthine and CO dehydrogenases maturation factor, XdhC/CoxF family [Rhizobium leguminosarum bv. trifolii WSM597]EJB08343.1 xanthine and CO dehydrogenases maturation factor, XdhC/CoxF family [Rhizobium leguminosarum bv. trifolii WSM597]
MSLHDYDEDELVLPRVALAADEPSEILRYAYDSFRAGIPVALVTLVDIRGGAARAIGAQMAVRGDGRYCGFVSGGCTEAAVAAEAVQALRKGHDRFLRLGEGSPFFDIVLPCGGGITLSIHILKKADPVGHVLSNLASRRPATLRYTPGSESMEFGGEGSRSQAGWFDGTFITHYQPRIRVLLCGGSVELTTTAAVARAAGYEVEQIDPAVDRNAFASKIDQFSAVALLFHDLHRELPLLQAALRSNSFYIGALGSRRTHEKRVTLLREHGCEDADIARIKAPIGLFDKARDASSIALSVVADIAAAKTRVPQAPLSYK